MTAELILCLLVAGFALGVSIIVAVVVHHRTTSYCGCTHAKADHMADGCAAIVLTRQGREFRCRCHHTWGYPVGASADPIR